MAITGIRERFGKGLSSEEKLADSTKALDAHRKNLSLALGGKEINPQIQALMTAFVREAQIQAHFQKRVAEAAAKEAARKAEAAKQAKLQNVVAQLAAQLGTLDPEKIIAALKAMPEPK